MVLCPILPANSIASLLSVGENSTLRGKVGSEFPGEIQKRAAAQAKRSDPLRLMRQLLEVTNQSTIILYTALKISPGCAHCSSNFSGSSPVNPLLSTLPIQGSRQI